MINNTIFTTYNDFYNYSNKNVELVHRVTSKYSYNHIKPYLSTSIPISNLAYLYLSHSAASETRKIRLNDLTIQYQSKYNL